MFANMTKLCSMISIKLLWICKQGEAIIAGAHNQGGISSQQFFTAKWCRQRVCIGSSVRNTRARYRFSSCCVSQRSNRNSREAYGVIKPRKSDLSHQHNLKKKPHKKTPQNSYLQIKLLSKAFARQRL